MEVHNLIFMEILEWIKKNKPQSVCIESAHIYMNEYPSDQHKLSAKIGSRLTDEIEKENCLVSKHLFIDNYNPDPSDFKLDVDAFMDILKDCGFKPDIVTFETSLEIPAKNLLSELEEDITHHEHYICLNQKQIRLMSHGRPTCNLLDTALYVAKLSMFGLSITILPNSFKEQQKKVRMVLRSLGYTHLPIINIYHDNKGKITIGSQS